jgi:biopolymer transport protein ExbD
MGLKRRSKVSAEFSMSSLTDIIFLLLIFFMLTSSLVRVNAFDLPESDSKTVAAQSVVVTIRKDGTHLVNDKEVSPGRISMAIRSVTASSPVNRENTTVTIAAEKGTPFDYVLNVMKTANNLRMKAILATQPKT